MQRVDLHCSRCIGLNVDTGVITGEAVTREIVHEKKMKDSISLKDVIIVKTICQEYFRQSVEGLETIHIYLESSILRSATARPVSTPGLSTFTYLHKGEMKRSASKRDQSGARAEGVQCGSEIVDHPESGGACYPPADCA